VPHGHHDELPDNRCIRVITGKKAMYRRRDLRAVEGPAADRFESRQRVKHLAERRLASEIHGPRHTEAPFPVLAHRRWQPRRKRAPQQVLPFVPGEQFAGRQ
jgi:hypothetical protein